MGEASSWLFIVSCAPYQHGLDSDPAIDTIMASGAFGQDVAVLFMDDGLKYLDTNLAAAEGQSDLRKLLKSLPILAVVVVIGGIGAPWLAKNKFNGTGPAPPNTKR